MERIRIVVCVYTTLKERSNESIPYKKGPYQFYKWNYNFAKQG